MGLGGLRRVKCNKTEQNAEIDSPFVHDYFSIRHCNRQKWQ